MLFLYIGGHTFAQDRPLGFYMEDHVNSVQIPFEIYNNLIVVPVLVQDLLPLKFILDTGVKTTIFTNKDITDFLGIVYSREISMAGTGGERYFTAYIADGLSLSLGMVRGRGHSAMVLESDFFNLSNYLGVMVHGILGYELFSRYIVDINYNEKILTIIKPQTFSLPRKFTSIPIVVDDTKPYIMGQINVSEQKRITTKLLIDTGASTGLMLQLGSDPILEIDENYIEAYLGRGIGGDIYGKIARVGDLHIGPFSLSGVIAGYPDLITSYDSMRFSLTKRHGVLGGMVLSRFHVIIDYPNDKIHLKSNQNFEEPFFYNLSGLELRASGEKLNIFHVAFVQKDTPAEKAGLKTGDQILKLNGRNAGTFTLEEINGLLNSKPNKKIKMEVMRKDEELKFEFRLEPRL